MGKTGLMKRTDDGFTHLFIGEYRHSLDSRKRVEIPEEWRKSIRPPQRLLAIPSSHERCIYLEPAADVVARLEKLAADSLTKDTTFNELIGAHTTLLEWDSSGRIRLPDALLAHAGIVREVRLIGALSHFELWGEEYAIQRAAEEMRDTVRTKLDELGI